VPPPCHGAGDRGTEPEKRRHTVKDVIELLEDAEKKVFCISVCGDKRRNAEYRNVACDLIRQAIAELKSPRWYTPEQWENQTGKALPDDWAVYINTWFRDSGKSVYIDGRWRVVTLKEAMLSEKILKSSRPARYTVTIVCATEAGPPPNDWRPEEENR
jgi:hypothetical protein